MYSTSWCPDCFQARYIFKKFQIDYLEIDIDKDAKAAEKVKELNNGIRPVPTILFPDGSILVEPSNSELILKLSPAVTSKERSS